MRFSTQAAAWVAAGLVLPAVMAQTSSPSGPVHAGQPTNCNGWHTVVTGDTCQTVSQRYGISLTQFSNYNPAVSADCLTNFWLGSAYCVRVGTSSSTKPMTTTAKSTSTSKAATTSKAASQTTIKSSITSAVMMSTISSSYNSTYSTLHPVTSWNVSTTSTDGAWPPTKTLAGQTPICNGWQLVVPGDTCELMLDKYSIRSVDDFLSWNPTAKDDCEMLIADYWVCISVQRQVGNTDLVWETAQPEYTEPPEPTVYIPATETPVDWSFTPSPSHGPMPANCKFFHKATANQNCNDLVNIYGRFTQQEFFSWNPALNGNCVGLWLDTYYCVGAYSDNAVLPPPASRSTKPTEGKIPLGYSNDCTRWYQTTGDDTCSDIALIFGSFSAAEFTKWNPSVFSDCAGLIQKAWYCIGRPGTPTTRTPGAPTTWVPSEISTTSTPVSTRPVTTTASTKVVASSSTRASTTSVAPTATSKPVSDTGNCGGVDGKTCLGSMFGNCCSSGGWCGTTPGHCAAGCQTAFGSCTVSSIPISDDGTCGGAGGKTCQGSEYGDCCSSGGWCGGSADHCTVGCQSGFGSCTVSSVPISDDGTCGGAGGKTCQGSEYGDCCSSGGWCGGSTAHCSAGCQGAFGTCTTANDKQSPDGSCGGANGYTCLDSGFGNCCSEYGWCGSSMTHCTAGCQAGFGTCT